MRKYQSRPTSGENGCSPTKTCQICRAIHHAGYTHSIHQQRKCCNDRSSEVMGGSWQREWMGRILPAKVVEDRTLTCRKTYNKNLYFNRINNIIKATGRWHFHVKFINRGKVVSTHTQIETNLAPTESGGKSWQQKTVQGGSRHRECGRIQAERTAEGSQQSMWWEDHGRESSERILIESVVEGSWLREWQQDPSRESSRKCFASSPRRPYIEDKRMVLEHTHGLFIT